MKKTLIVLLTSVSLLAKAQKANIVLTTAQDLIQTSKSNKYTLIYFWTTWCHPCIEKLPDIVKNVQEHPGVKLMLVCDAHSENKKIQKFVTISKFLDTIVYKLDKNIYKYSADSNIRKFTKEICPECFKESGDEFRLSGVYLFNQKGDILYYNNKGDCMDEVKELLKKY